MCPAISSKAVPPPARPAGACPRPRSRQQWGDDGRRHLPDAARGARGYRDADARLHDGPRPRRPVFGLKHAIDEGVIAGPRIYPSGAMISQTSGHGDFRFPFEVPRIPGGSLSQTELLGVAAIADSPDEVRLRAREQLRLGASQIKLMAGGGVSSPLNPIESTQFTEPELRAAVEAAENWGTYVTVHAYMPRAIRQAVSAGVRCIDHGQLIDEPTAELLADEGIWWSLQPLTYDEAVFARMSPTSQTKALQVFEGTARAYELARKYGVRTAWGADILFHPTAAARQGSYLSIMTRWYTPAEALKMATADNAELLALSGFINPYPGRLGVVQEGALADLLLVDGNPLEDLSFPCRRPEGSRSRLTPRAPRRRLLSRCCARSRCAEGDACSQ
jgi:imidazolonepropionase-like amidohydrolase